MGWQDDPVVDQPAWASDPVVVAPPQAANPFNRQLGADVSYGQPLGPPPQRDLAGEFRAAAGGPVMDRAAAWLQTYLPQPLGGTGQDYSTNLAQNRAVTSEVQAQHPASAAAGTLAGTLPVLAVPGVGGAGVMAGIRGGAIAGGLEGAANSPDWTDLGQTARDAGLGAIAGGVTGGAVPAVVGAAGRAISPFTISPERQAMVDALRGAGVPVTAGQATGSDVLRSLESSAFGAKRAGIAQGQDFTKALMERGGIPASDALQPSIKAANKEISDVFDILGTRNSVIVDDGLRNGVLDAVSNYKRLGGSSPGVEAAANDLLYRNEPSIAGDAYNAMRSRLGKDAQALRKSDPIQAQAYRDIQGALDDSMERSIAANNPNDFGAFKEVRREYGNLQDVAKAASKITGENAIAGAIPPSRMQTVLSSGNMAPSYAAGRGDLAELTRAGAGLLAPPARTGPMPITHPLAHALLGGTLGGSYGGYYGGPQGALEGLVGGALLPKIAGSALMTRPAQALLKNQVAAGLRRGPAKAVVSKAAALAAALGGQ